MKAKEKSPILNKEIERFLEENPKIKESLKLFAVSEEQYLKAIRSTEPQPTTSTTTEIEIDS